MQAPAGLLLPCLLAPEVACVLRVAATDVLSVFGVRTQRAAAPWKCFAGADDEVRRGIFLNPIDDRAKHVEMVERWTATTMSHAGNEKDATPLGDSVGTAICCRE